jgi:non-specific serine/threonine protein kinase
MKTDRRIIPDLPDKTELEVICGLVPAQAALYERVVAELARDLKCSEGLRKKGLILAALLKLKQVCNHPCAAIGHGDFRREASGKLLRLATLAESIAERGERLLAFTQFREMTDVLARELAAVFGKAGAVLHGETPVPDRQALVRDFQRPDGPPFLVLSLKAGGTGLTLTAAQHVVHFDRWWNPAVEDQATDRAYRIGQHANVLVHKLHCAGTLEERIAAMLLEKRALAGRLLGTAGDQAWTELPDEELLRLVALDINKTTLDA